MYGDCHLGGIQRNPSAAGHCRPRRVFKPLIQHKETVMQINVGNLDRIVRIVVGLVLLSLPLWLDSSWRWLGLIGIMPLITGLAGRCPGYRLLGLSTCPIQKKKPE